MVSLSREQKIITVVSVLFVLTIAIGVGIIYPTVSYIMKINQNTLDLRLYLERRYENVRKMHNSLQQVNEIREKVANYDQYLFHPGDELALITALENLSARHQVEQKIDSTNLDQANKKQVNIGLTVTGGYNDLLDYLSDLESFNYFLNVTQLHWSALFADGSEATKYQIRLQLSLYVNQ